MATATEEKKAGVIAELTALGVLEVNPATSLAKLEAMLKEKKGESTNPPLNTGMKNPEAVVDTDEFSKLMTMMSTMIGKIDNIDKRVDRMETGGREDFKNDAKEVDVERAAQNKANLDQKVVKIVEETLGVDFGIDLESFQDKPGFLFTVIVPKRLSDLPESQRPVVDQETGKYKIMKDGGPYDYVMETYQPEDRRSKQIGSGQSYDSIRDHCNRVRSYIVSYYQKMKKPLPEFKLK